VLTASVWQVRQPLYTSPVGRWRNYRAPLGPLLDGLKGLVSNDKYLSAAMSRAKQGRPIHPAGSAPGTYQRPTRFIIDDRMSIKTLASDQNS
jgi:hypothetical protein